MAVSKPYIKGKHILAVDDEEDILATIEDVLEGARVDRASDYETASRKIKENYYDLAILDIMGVNGLQLLEEAVDRGILTVMLTAHAINPETLMESIRKDVFIERGWAYRSDRRAPGRPRSADQPHH